MFKVIFTMKAIKWTGAGANLFDPAYAHLITPRYEDGLLQAAESPNTLGQDCGSAKRQRRLLSTDRSGSVDCRRHGAILSFHL